MDKSLVKERSGRDGPTPQRRQRAVDRLAARHLPAGLFRQSYQPPGRHRPLVGPAANVRELTRPVAAKDYWIKGRIRHYLATQVFNAMLIDRTEIKVHQSPVDVMIREIGQRYSLIVFPEGGRGDGQEIGEFKSGLYYLSKKRPDLELIPVYIDNMNRILPRGKFLPVPLLSCITFGPPMWLESGESKDGSSTGPATPCGG